MKLSVTNMYVYKNIWNGIGKVKYKFSLHLWVGMWVGEDISWNILTQKYAMSGLAHEIIYHKYVHLQKHLEWNR